MATPKAVMLCPSVTFFRYLPVGDADKRWGFYVTTVGHSCCAPHAPYPPAQHPAAYHFFWERGRILSDFQVVYITRGKGTLETASCGCRTIAGGHVFMLFPGEWHRYHPDPGVGWEEHWLGFAGEYARQLLKKRLFSPRAPVFSVGADHATTGAFARAVELVRLEPVGFQQAVAAVTWEVLGRIHSAERLRAVEADGLGRIVRETKLHLAERLEQPIDLHALANHLAVSYSTLRQAFKHHTGFAPHQYQLELRVAEAKHLLAGSVLPVKEIAARLGFQSPSYFSRLFKNRTGLSPETWRHDAQSGDHASREEH